MFIAGFYPREIPWLQLKKRAPDDTLFPRSSKNQDIHLRVSWPRVDVPLDLASPSQEAPQIMALTPHKFPKFYESNLLHLDACVGLNPPEKIGAPPRSEAMALCGVPDKPDGVLHGDILNTIHAGV